MLKDKIIRCICNV